MLGGGAYILIYGSCFLLVLLFVMLGVVLYIVGKRREKKRKK